MHSSKVVYAVYVRQPSTLYCCCVLYHDHVQWGWQHKYGLQEMADDMLRRLAKKYNIQLPAQLADGQQVAASGAAAAATAGSAA